jgi:hypothetical protein
MIQIGSVSLRVQVARLLVLGMVAGLAGCRGCGSGGTTDSGGGGTDATGGTDAAGPGTDSTPPASDATSTDAAPGTDAAPCAMVESAVPNEGWTHVTEGSVVTYAHNPPASGNHYPIWARYEVFTAAIPRGYYVHNLEHGAIVLLYRPDADPSLIAALEAAYTAIPDEVACGHKRSLLTPDPELDDLVAVVAADNVLEGDCVDEAAIVAFALAHRNMAPENVCAPGSYP